MGLLVARHHYESYLPRFFIKIIFCVLCFLNHILHYVRNLNLYFLKTES